MVAVAQKRTTTLCIEVYGDLMCDYLVGLQFWLRLDGVIVAGAVIVRFPLRLLVGMDAQSNIRCRIQVRGSLFCSRLYDNICRAITKVFIWKWPTAIESERFSLHRWPCEFSAFIREWD